MAPFLPLSMSLGFPRKGSGGGSGFSLARDREACSSWGPSVPTHSHFDICLPQSIIRVVFHDRRLQYMEHQQLEGWRWSRPGDRILDIGESPQPVPNLNTWTTWGFFVDPTWNYAHREAQLGGTCMQSQHWRWLRQRLTDEVARLVKCKHEELSSIP